jgi:hypothetical protein
MFTNEPPHIGMSSLDEPHDSCMKTLYGVIGPVFPVMHRDRLGAFTYEPDTIHVGVESFTRNLHFAVFVSLSVTCFKTMQGYYITIEDVNEFLCLLQT